MPVVGGNDSACWRDRMDSDARYAVAYGLKDG